MGPVNVKYDENGNPLIECPEHGWYRVEDFECPGCAEIERQIDESIERDHKREGR